MNNYIPNKNTYIRTLVSRELSAITLSFYKMNLILSFAPYTGVDNRGIAQYDRLQFLSTSLNHEGAAYFYYNAMSVFSDEAEQIEAILPCNNNSNLVFEYKTDYEGQKRAFLTINKNNRSIPFKFATHPCEVKENGRMVTKIIQTGVGVFAMTLKGYLVGTGSDLHLSKLTEEEMNN